MNKGIIIRASLIFSSFLIIILVAVGCELFDGEAVEAQISNPDGVYVSVDGLDITNEELWDVMKNVDGLEYLFDYVEEYLLADYIEDLTQEEIDAEIRLLTYLTKDEEVIADIMDNEELHQDYLDAFRQNVAVLGYDVDDQESLNEFVGLSIAKRNYVKELLMNETDAESRYYIQPSAFETFYRANNKGNVCSLDIRFQNTQELDQVLRSMNYIINFQSDIGLYTGTGDASEMSKADFTEDNTRVLTDEEVWEMYVKVYNYMNPYKTQLSETITKEDFCANHADIAVKNFDELTEFKADQDPNVILAQYIFDELDLEDDKLDYTFTDNEVIGDFVVMSFKLTQDDVTAWEDLDAAAQNEVKAELFEQAATDQLIAAAMEELYEENGLEIFDPQLQLKYEFQAGITYDNKGSETLVAKLNDKDITADDLFEYMEGRIGVFYTLEVAKIKVLVNSDAYTEMYGDSHDYINNKSDKMVEHRDSLREMKSIFSSNGYSSYGYSSSAMTWEEFIYLAFGVESEADLIEAMFVVNELQFDFKFDQVKYASAVAYMQDKIDRYFSLNVSHLLIYVDMDNDFTPDDFSDFYDGLDAAEKVEFDALKVAFENTVKVKLETMTLEEVVSEYTATLMTDTDSDWYEFKNYGFFIMTENLGEIDHFTSESLDEDFAASLKRIYNDYQNDKDELQWIDDQITMSDFGIHFITATKGQNFDMKSAEFEFTTENQDDYSVGSDNDSDLPSAAQVQLWLDIKDADAKGEPTDDILLPGTVKAAIDYYYGPVYNAYMSQTAFSINMGQYLLDNNVTYTNDNVANVTELTELVEVFEEVNFPELFDRDAE